MKAYSKIHFENENMFFEKWNIINRFTIVFFGKLKKTPQETFHIWKWKHISKKNHILKMKAHSKTRM